jgi:hypothetical protein
MPEKEAWSQSGFYGVLLRSENENGGRNVVSPDHKTPICGLDAVFMRSISGKRQGKLFLQGLTKIRDRPDNLSRENSPAESKAR